MDRFRIDGLTLVAVIFLGFFGFNIIRDGLSHGRDDFSTRPPSEASAGGPNTEVQADRASGQVVAPGAAAPDGVAHVLTDLLTPSAPGDPGDPNTIVFPYTDFIVTQGVHGAEYGQMAVDIAAGKGAPIKSPINATVSALYVDEYGNPVLVLDNSRWTVMLYHGQFSVKVGDTVTLGSPVGLESNQGYTVDGFGQICTGRDCGYHTHINVYDKQLGANVNPLEILQRLTP